MERLDDPRFIYLLGFIWGDGCITYTPKSKHYRIIIGIVSPDADVLEGTFRVVESIYRWNRKWQPPRQPNSRFTITSKPFYDFLASFDYRSKSGSPDKILDKIPQHLRHFWFRGLFDADGHVRLTQNSRNPNHSSAIAAIYGPYDQDWTYVQNLCQDLGVKFTIRRRHRDTGSSSEIILCKKTDVINFIGYLYQGYEIDQIGLKRKQAKLKEIIDSVKGERRRVQIRDYAIAPSIQHATAL